MECSEFSHHSIHSNQLINLGQAMRIDNDRATDGRVVDLSAALVVVGVQTCATVALPDNMSAADGLLGRAVSGR